jgi:hypothetical protein
MVDISLLHQELLGTLQELVVPGLLAEADQKEKEKIARILKKTSTYVQKLIVNESNTVNDWESEYDIRSMWNDDGLNYWRNTSSYDWKSMYSSEEKKVKIEYPNFSNLDLIKNIDFTLHRKFIHGNAEVFDLPDILA